MLPAQQTFPCQLSARLTIWCCGERTQSHARELPGRATSSSVRLPTNLHVQCRKGGTPVRCCVSLPGWVNTSNKRLKVGASFPGFYFLQITRLARLPLLTPRTITYNRASQQKTCLFHPAAGESHPSRLRAAISSQVTASASRPPSFTFLSLPVRQWVLISRWTPARASRPDNITFSTPRPARLTHLDREYFPPVGCRREPPGHTSYILCLYLSNAESLDLPLDAGEVLPARQSCYSVFTCPTQRVLISRWTPARCSRPDKSCFLLSLPVQHGESWSPVGRRRGAPGQTNALPSARTKNIEPRRTWHTWPFWQSKLSVHHRRGSTTQLTSINLTSDAARTSRLDNLTFSSFVSEANPSNRRARPPVGCRLSIPTKLYLSVFTCPTQWVLISHRTPARCSRPDNFTFSSPTLATLTRPTQRVLCPRWASTWASQRDVLPLPPWQTRLTR